MFIENKYYFWYYNIIHKARSRIKTAGYFEKHHILPKSLGGGNSVDNLVLLTAREHFICHILLTKITSGKDKKKMIFASNRMLYGKNRYIPNSRIYETIRKESSILLKNINTGQIRSSDTCQKISIGRKGKGLGKQSEDHINKRVSKITGSKRSEDTKEKMSMDRKNKPQTQEHIDKRQKLLIGKIRTEESKEKYRKCKTGSKNPNAKSVSINGIYYDTKREACISLNITLRELNKITCP